MGGSKFVLSGSGYLNPGRPELVEGRVAGGVVWGMCFDRLSTNGGGAAPAPAPAGASLTPFVPSEVEAWAASDGVWGMSLDFARDERILL